MKLSDQLAINKDGLLWPKEDIRCYPTVKDELAEIPTLLGLCQQKRTCIQAGGNGGLWVDLLADAFETVYTFEPDSLNFRCLVNNVDRDNVVFTNAAVGADRDFIAVDRWCGMTNVGAHRIDIENKGRIPVVRIDDYRFQNVDLIQLDVEGFEHDALLGAWNTIQRCKPIISVEQRKNGLHYGVTDEQVRDWLRFAGYELAEAINFDEFWRPVAA